MRPAKTYPGKLLLFGEYTVIQGSDALAIPFPYFKGQWKTKPSAEDILKRQMSLPDFADYLKEQTRFEGFSPNMDRFKEVLKKGLYFESSIPAGYGAGSSGALCAAIYDLFFEDKSQDPVLLKKVFSVMESYFHGSSSGLDPLVSYLHQTIHIRQGEMTLKKSIQPKLNLFLIDTHIPRKTEPLVEIFLRKCKNPIYEKTCKDELVPLVNHSIRAYLSEEATTLFHHFHDISRFQFIHFEDMIPASFQSLWKEGLQSADFKLKLCGAGGGGFILGIGKAGSNWEEKLQKYSVIIL